MKKIPQNEIIKRFKKRHGNTYDYSIVEYKNSRTKLSIICHQHGIFFQTSHVHQKHGCPKCSNNVYTNESFIKKITKIHNNKYDYSLVDYIDSKTKVKIICPTHGEFEQTPNSHIEGSGCKRCSHVTTTEDFIRKSKKKYEKYDYSLVSYLNKKTKVKIICPDHGIFETNPSEWLKTRCNGCKRCSQVYNTTDFIKKSQKIHNNKYDYSLVNYINNKTKVKIICPDHGEFLQSPRVHTNERGCPNCSISKGELKIMNLLKEHNILFIQQKRFDNCRDKYPLSFDFYLPDYNLCIEYDGDQHTKIVSYWGGIKTLKYIQKHDKIKNEYCINNNINLLRLNPVDQLSLIIEKVDNI